MLVRVFEDNPQSSVIAQVDEILSHGGVVIMPLDGRYCLVGDALQPHAVQTICDIKGLIKSVKTPLTIVCKDLSQASTYAKIDNASFSIMRQNVPGAFTFVLPAGGSLPKIFKQRKEVGVRIPQGGIINALFALRNEPLITASLPSAKADEDEAYLYHPELIEEEWGEKVDLILDAGEGAMERTTIVRLMDPDEIEIIREGAGELQL